MSDSVRRQTECDPVTVLETGARNFLMAEQAWVDIYQKALMELSHATMRGRIGNARAGIRSHVEKLKGIPGLNPAEHQAIDDALNALRFLEREEERYDENQTRETLMVATRKIRSLAPKIKKLDNRPDLKFVAVQSAVANGET
jgi:hypothetical protein